MRPQNGILDFLGSDRMKWPWFAFVVLVTLAGGWCSVNFLLDMNRFYGGPDMGSLMMVSLVALPWFLWMYRYGHGRAAAKPDQ